MLQKLIVVHQHLTVGFVHEASLLHPFESVCNNFNVAASLQDSEMKMNLDFI